MPSEIPVVDELAAAAFRRHYRQIFRFVRRRSSSHEDAEDVTAEVFAAVAALRAFEAGATPLLAWLYTVARRRLADQARRRARSPQLTVADASLDYGTDVARALRLALRRLPESQRRVVVLKLIEGRTYREIAERLGTTQAACKMRLARGLERLRDELEQEGVEP